VELSFDHILSCGYIPIGLNINNPSSIQQRMEKISNDKTQRLKFMKTLLDETSMLIIAVNTARE
jgi:hypothetical protein